MKQPLSSLTRWVVAVVVAGLETAASGAGFLDINGKFTTIIGDPPSGNYTDATGINNAGHIVGNNGGHGFLKVGGTFSIIDVPGSDFTSATGINNAGHIVGWFDDGQGRHGFLDVGGTFSTIDVPGASSTEATGINNAGH